MLRQALLLLLLGFAVPPALASVPPASACPLYDAYNGRRGDEASTSSRLGAVLQHATPEQCMQSCSAEPECTCVQLDTTADCYMLQPDACRDPSSLPRDEYYSVYVKTACGHAPDVRTRRAPPADPMPPKPDSPLPAVSSAAWDDDLWWPPMAQSSSSEPSFASVPFRRSLDASSTVDTPLPPEPLPLPPPSPPPYPPGQAPPAPPPTPTFECIPVSHQPQTPSGASTAGNGMVVFAPYSSSCISTFDPSTNGTACVDISWATSNASLFPLGQSAMFRGSAAVAGTSLVVFAPLHSNCVGTFDATTTTFRCIEIFASHQSGCFASQSRPLFASATYVNSNLVVFSNADNGACIGKFDPTTDGFESVGPILNGNGGRLTHQFGSALAPNGKVVTSTGLGSHFVVFDPDDDTYFTVDTGLNDWLFAVGGATTAGNGHVVMSPNHADCIGTYDAAANVFACVDISAQFSQNNKFDTAVTAPNGLVVLAPGWSNQQCIGIFDAVTKSLTCVSISAVTSTGNFYRAFGVAAVTLDGRIVFAGSDNGQACIGSLSLALPPSPPPPSAPPPSPLAPGHWQLTCGPVQSATPCPEDGAPSVDNADVTCYYRESHVRQMWCTVNHCFLHPNEAYVITESPEACLDLAVRLNNAVSEIEPGTTILFDCYYTSLLLKRFDRQSQHVNRCSDTELGLLAAAVPGLNPYCDILRYGLTTPIPGEYGDHLVLADCAGNVDLLNALVGAPMHSPPPPSPPSPSPPPPLPSPLPSPPAGPLSLSKPRMSAGSTAFASQVHTRPPTPYAASDTMYVSLTSARACSSWPR